MTKFFQPSAEVQVSCRHRIANGLPVREESLSFAQQVALASWDQSPPAARPTRPDAPAARFQGFRVPCLRATR